MPRRRRRLLVLLLPAGALVLIVAFVLARFLTTENRERDAIFDLLALQVRGDAAGVRRALHACDARCGAGVRATTARLRDPGGAEQLKIVRLDSGTAYSLGDDEAWSRVVWIAGPDARPVVQCVLVRRKGSPLTGRSVSLLRLTAPLADNEDPC